MLLGAGPAAAADAVKTPTFTKDVAPIFQDKCEACHRPDSMAPMSLVTFRKRGPWARVDQGARRGAADAALAHRQDRRHPGVQERPVAHRRADRHDRALGRRRRAEGRSEGHAAGRRRGRTTSVWNFAKMFGGPPDLVVKSPSYTMPAQAQDAWWKPVVETGRDRSRAGSARSRSGPRRQRAARSRTTRIARLLAGRPIDNAAAANPDDDSGINAAAGHCSWSGRSASRAR